MNTILAIDPGNTHSAYVVIDVPTRRPLRGAKIANDHLLELLDCLDLEPFAGREPTHYAIEMIAAYGMPVGADVFETCVWIGRFTEAIRRYDFRRPLPALVKRNPIKLHHCHSPKANDATIKRALIDRFAPGVRNYGKGTKANPGWFHGFAADIWQAYALAVYAADTFTKEGAA